MTKNTDHLPTMLCEAEFRAATESLVMESFLQFAQRIGMGKAKQDLAKKYDLSRDAAA